MDNQKVCEGFNQKTSPLEILKSYVKNVCFRSFFSGRRYINSTMYISINKVVYSKLNTNCQAQFDNVSSGEREVGLSEQWGRQGLCVRGLEVD